MFYSCSRVYHHRQGICASLRQTASGSSQDNSGIGGGANAKLLAGGTSPAIHIGLGQPNLVAVIAIGNAIYLYINKQYFAGVSEFVMTPITVLPEMT
jgi:hypothetical protein